MAGPIRSPMGSVDAAPIGVTGASGAVGGAVARLLATAQVPLRLVVRDPARAPELAGAEVREATYGDGDALRAAFDGVETLLFVSGSEAVDRLGQHRAVVDAAAAAGVAHVVYLSFLGAAPDATFTFARDHWHTEEHLRAAGLAHTSLRDSLYLDLLPHLVGDDGVIRGPAGAGRLAPVARQDVARAAAAVLLAPGAHAGATYELTGPELVTLGEVAGALTSVTGRSIAYVPETVEEAYRSRAHLGAPGWEVAGWVTSYVAIATGELEVVSGDVELITGRVPEGLRDWLGGHPEAWRHLVR